MPINSNSSRADAKRIAARLPPISLAVILLLLLATAANAAIPPISFVSPKSNATSSTGGGNSTADILAVVNPLLANINATEVLRNTSLVSWGVAMNESMKEYVDALPPGGNASFNQSLTDERYRLQSLVIDDIQDAANQTRLQVTPATFNFTILDDTLAYSYYAGPGALFWIFDGYAAFYNPATFYDDVVMFGFGAVNGTFNDWVYAPLINTTEITADGSALNFSNDAGSTMAVAKDILDGGWNFFGNDISNVGTLDVDVSATISGLYLTNQTITAPVGTAQIDGGSGGVILEENSNPHLYANDDAHVVAVEQFLVNASGTTSTVIQQAVGGTHDVRDYVYNEYASEWYRIMDDSTTYDCWVWGHGSSPISSKYMQFCSNGRITMFEDLTISAETTFDGNTNYAKAQHENYAVGLLEENSNTPDVGKAENRLLTNCPSGCNINQFIGTETGQHMKIYCADGTRFSNSTKVWLKKADGTDVTGYDCKANYENLECDDIGIGMVLCEVPS